MKRSLVCICGVRGYEKDGVAYLHIEDSARGLGFTQTQNKNGVEYTSIRWTTVEGYLVDFGFPQQVGESGNPHDYYIPENIFYRLCMKAKNEVAEAFQAKVADEIIPSIRKTGGYSVAQPELSDAEIMSRALEIAHRTLALREERIKALTAERDEAIRTKAMIGSKREATAMATASAKSRECEKLREQIGDSKTHKAVTAITWLPDYFNISDRGVYIALAHKLKKLEAEMPPKYAHIDIEDPRWGSVKAYHVDVIERLHEMVQADEDLMKKYRKIASV